MDNIEERLWAAIEEDDFEVVSLEGTELAQRAAAYQKMQSLFGLLCSPASEGAGQEDFFEQPSQIGRYQVRKKLGEGGFGRVFLAYDPMLNRLVAVKIPRPELFPSEGDLERFVREAELGASVKHPGLVTVYDVCRDQESCYIVMEYIEGGVLSDVIGESNLGLNQRVQIIIDLASALDHAHRAGLVHRDIKPSNIFLDRNGSPHIGDFGLAITPSNSRHQHESAAGTPLYMSPELLGKNPSRPDKCSDIWSLGVVLYELLTGTHPFALRENDEVFQLVLASEQGLLKDRNLVVSDSLEECCKKALNKNPAERYAHAAEFADELRLAIYQAPSNTSSVRTFYGPEVPTASQEPVKPFAGFKARFSASLVLVSVVFLLTLVFFVMKFRGTPLAEDLKRSGGARNSLLEDESPNSVETHSSSDGGELQSVRDPVAALADVSTYTFDHVPLQQVIKTLEKRHRVPIHIDVIGMNMIGLGQDEPVTVSINDVSLRTLLRQILVENLELTFYVLDDVIVVTTRFYADILERLSAQFERRVSRGGDELIKKAMRKRYSGNVLTPLSLNEGADYLTEYFGVPIRVDRESLAKQQAVERTLYGGNDYEYQFTLIPEVSLKSQLLLMSLSELLVVDVLGNQIVITTEENMGDDFEPAFGPLSRHFGKAESKQEGIAIPPSLAMNTRSKQDFSSTDLATVKLRLMESHSVNIYIDHASLNYEGISAYERFSLDLSEATLETYLQRIFVDEFGLAFHLLDDVIVVTSKVQSGYLRELSDQFSARLKKYGSKKLESTVDLAFSDGSGMKSLPIKEVVGMWSAEFEIPITLNAAVSADVGAELAGGMSNDVGRCCYGLLVPQFALRTQLLLTCYIEHLVAEVDGDRIILTTNDDLRNRRVSGFEKLAKSRVNKKELLLSITRRKRDAKYRLRDRTSQSFNDLPLDEAIQQIAVSHDVPMYIDYRALNAIGLSGKEPITLNLKDVTLLTFFRQMLREELLLGVYAFDDLLLVTNLDFMDLIEDELALMDANLYGGSVLSKSSLLERPYVGRSVLVSIEEAVDRLNAQFRFEKKLLLDDGAVKRVTSEFWGANEDQRYIQVELLPGVSLKTHLVMIAYQWGLTATIHEGQLVITTPELSEE